MESNNLQKSKYKFETSGTYSVAELAFEPYLYFHPDHLKLQPNQNLFSYLLRNLKTNKIDALFPVFVNDGQAFSPFRGPFGGIQFSADLPAYFLNDFVENVLKTLSSKGISQFSVTSFPGAYQADQAALLSHVLLQNNFRILHSQLNHHIPVTNSDFSDQLHNSAKRRLKKNLNAGFTVQKEKTETLPEVYEKIKTWRSQKGIPVSLSLNQIQELFTRFPDNFQIFSVKTGSEIIAATITIQVSSNILYTYLPANSSDFNSFSPVVLLNNFIYDYCRQHKISIFDLGISSVPEQENWPLITFKERLGGIATQKLSFTKKLV